MNRVRIKVCGITSPSALQAAVDAGVDAVGFVMSHSPRQLDTRRVAVLMQLLPSTVASVVVTRQPPAGFAEEVIAVLRPNWWQSDLDDLDGQRVAAGTGVIPVVREGEQPLKWPPRFVYEGVNSGRGETVDWDTAADVGRRGQMILAGGLHPGNVAAAIRKTRPWGVDVSSGVESAPGKKDPAAIIEFVNAVQRGSGLGSQ